MHPVHKAMVKTNFKTHLLHITMYVVRNYTQFAIIALTTITNCHDPSKKKKNQPSEFWPVTRKLDNFATWNNFYLVFTIIYMSVKKTNVSRTFARGSCPRPRPPSREKKASFYCLPSLDLKNLATRGVCQSLNNTARTLHSEKLFVLATFCLLFYLFRGVSTQDF